MGDKTEIEQIMNSTKRRRGKPKKYFWIPEHDDLIRKRYDSKTDTITDLSSRIGFPRWVIRRRAMELGVARIKEQDWTKEEVAYLEKHYCRFSLHILARKLGRTVTAIVLKKRRLGITKTQEGYTLRGLCEGLGVDHHKVDSWIEKGWIGNRGRGVERPQGDYRFFTDHEIRKFVKKHPDQIDLRRVEKLWFIDVLIGLDNHIYDSEGSDVYMEEDEE